MNSYEQTEALIAIDYIMGDNSINIDENTFECNPFDDILIEYTKSFENEAYNIKPIDIMTFRNYEECNINNPFKTEASELYIAKQINEINIIQKFLKRQADDIFDNIMNKKNKSSNKRYKRC